jgi:copper chaperone CopZ
MKIIATIEGMSCQHCLAHVQKALVELPGVSGVKVDLKKGQAEFKASALDQDLIKNTIAAAGYTLVKVQQV